MANPVHHAMSSAKKRGGKYQDYLAIHEWFDASKEHLGNFRHRALRHHSQGIYEAQRVFGDTITNSDGREVPVRWIAEQHVIEDIGFIPTVADWLGKIQQETWMVKVPSKLAREFEREEKEKGEQKNGHITV